MFTYLLGHMGASDPAEITHTASVSAPASAPASPWAPTGVSFGAAQADRHIIVAVSNISAAYIPYTSVTIGGVGATLLGRAGSSMLGDLSLWIAAVPTGTSGTVSAAYGTTPTYVGMDVFRVTGLSSTTPINTYNVQGGSAAAINFGTIASPSSGFVLACTAGWTNSAATKSWSGTLGVTETSDYDPNGFNDIRQSSATFSPSDGSSGTVTSTSTVAYVSGRRGGFAVTME